jgi:hypothetical protein
MSSAANSIVREIQRDILEGSISLSSILRKARLAARKLDLKEFEKWILLEADGYKEIQNKDMPGYRNIRVTPRFFNPYNGWCPIFIQDNKLHEICSSVFIRQPIEEIETLSASTGELTTPYSKVVEDVLRRGMDLDFEIRGMVSPTSLLGIINSVKNTVLDWAVDLEKANVFGEGLGFSGQEKAQAANVTQNIYAQNIGNLGNVTGNSKVTSSVSDSTFNAGQVSTYIQQIRDTLPALPAAQREAVERELKALERDQSDISSVRRHFESIKTICEGAAGVITQALA